MSRHRLMVAALFAAVAAIAAATTAGPTLAQPIPIDLQRLPYVPVQVWNDVNGDGGHDSGDVLLATTWTDLSGYWQVTGLATNQSHRLIVAPILSTCQGLRIGGDLYSYSQSGVAPINGAPGKLWSDSHSPMSYFGSSDDLISSNSTHCVSLGKCGDYRLPGTNTSDAQGVVLALSGTAATFGGYRGYLWDATLDGD